MTPISVSVLFLGLMIAIPGTLSSSAAFYCDFAPTVSNGGSVTPTLPAPPGYHANTVVTSSCAKGFESTSGSKTAECSAANTWTPASLECSDINECGPAGSCQNALCYNTKGSYTCTCNSGYSANGICTVCYAGVKDGRVKDAQMTASRSFNGYTPSKGRLDGPGSWISQYGQVGDWLQVDFIWNKKIYGVITQGAFGNWVTKFVMEYSTNWTYFKHIYEGSRVKVFNGNIDWNTHKINRFPHPITARFFRLVVVAMYSSYPFLRLEYLTC